MIEKMVEYHVMFYAMGAAFMLGVLGRMVSYFTLRRILREAERVHSSEHRLMKLIKAKYEHANLIADRVKNVDAFVDKYLFEYKVCGISLYSWLSLPLRMLWLVLFFGMCGFGAICGLYGFGENAFRILALMGVLGMLLFLLHVMSGQEQKMEGVRTYLVDYLDNVCAHRYAKLAKVEPEKEEKEITQNIPPIKAPVEEEKEVMTQEMRIREILEEFLA